MLTKGLNIGNHITRTHHNYNQNMVHMVQLEEALALENLLDFTPWHFQQGVQKQVEKLDIYEIHLVVL
jgi:hypothetical protein